MMLKLPAAWFTGVRVKEINNGFCVVTVKLKWLNQNPFKSMFWAVQGMAAEMSTGALVMREIQESGKRISMLVAQNNAVFTKKATGKITFTCKDGELIRNTIKKAVETGGGHTCWMEAVGVNVDGVVVSTFKFEWTVKAKQ